MKAHTKEPWKVVRPGHGHQTDYLCVQIGKDRNYTTLELKPQDARRIVTCVNSLAGIPDPEAALTLAREALETWNEFIKEELSPFDEPCDATGDGDMCPKCQSTGCIKLKIDALRNAIAALTPKPEQQRE